MLAKGFTSTQLGEGKHLVTLAMQDDDKCIIDPQRSRWTKQWDILMLLALAFTAVVTPVEVAFLDEGEYITPLWVWNRVVDLIFLLDMLITFNMAYQEEPDIGGHWVFSRRRIAIRYLCTWFVIDLFSVLPFFLITLRYDDLFNANASDDSNNVGAMTRATVLFRVVKLLRMLKLARIFKATQVIERHILDVVLTKWEWTYSQLKAIKLIAWLILYSHAQACVWGLFSAWMPAPNWIDKFDTAYMDLESAGVPPTPLDRYSAALYWSLMTLTSIGYGDIVPQNTTERIICAVLMLLSGMMWTYVIGNVAAIATTLNPNRVLYENTMDQLNYFMRQRALPRSMRMTLREFFTQARRINQMNEDGDLLEKMSPLLQGSVALAANKEWVTQIWFLRDINFTLKGTFFIAGLAKALILRNYVANERLPIGQLYILRRGLCVKMWRFLQQKKVWGEDMIIDSPELVDHAQAVALTYVEVFTLRRKAFYTLLKEYAEPRQVVRRAARRITLQRALLKYLTQATGKKGPASFVLRSMSRGADEVDDRLTTENKVDLTLEKLDEIDKQIGDGKGPAAAAVTAASKGSPSGRALPEIGKPPSSPPVGSSSNGGQLADARLDTIESTLGGLKQEVATVKSDVADIKRMLATLLER